MFPKPINPRTHGAIDYGFVAMQMLAPTLFGFKRSARMICYAFGISQGIINALTDHPLAVKRLIPLRVHGQLEVPLLPALLIVPWLTGATRQRAARHYFHAFFPFALANFLLTDYNACQPAAVRVRAARRPEYVPEPLA